MSQNQNIWSIHRVTLPTHNLQQAKVFFETYLGLGKARNISDTIIAFGSESRGLRVQKAMPAIAMSGSNLLVQACARTIVALEVEDVAAIAQRLSSAAIPFAEAAKGDFDSAAIYTQDRAFNIVAFCQAEKQSTLHETIRPWEKQWGWGIHHVNLMAANVRENLSFYTEIAGLKEGQWQAPAARGDFSIDPEQLAILQNGKCNRGVHIISADAGFGHRNNFPHNPSIGGHPAFFVPNVLDVKKRLEANGVLVSDARVYAMEGMHQIYALDPTANVIEINQFI